MTTKSLDEILQNDMNDPEFVAAYLQVAFEEDGVEGVTDALQHIARVRAMNNEGSPEPSFRSVYETLGKLGFNVQFVGPNAEMVGLPYIK